MAAAVAPPPAPISYGSWRTTSAWASPPLALRDGCTLLTLTPSLRLVCDSPPRTLDTLCARPAERRSSPGATLAISRARPPTGRCCRACCMRRATRREHLANPLRWTPSRLQGSRRPSNGACRSSLVLRVLTGSPPNCFATICTPSIGRLMAIGRSRCRATSSPNRAKRAWLIPRRSTTRPISSPTRRLAGCAAAPLRAHSLRISRSRCLTRAAGAPRRKRRSRVSRCQPT